MAAPFSANAAALSTAPPPPCGEDPLRHGHPRGRDRTPAARARLHDPWCPCRVRRLAQSAAEVLAGVRAPGQLSPYLTARPLELLARRAGAYRFRAAPRVLSTRSRPGSPGCVETVAVIACGSNHRALAMRLARTPRGWVCTHLEGEFGRSG